MNNKDTIAAVATGTGGAISIVRVSGPDALAVCDRVFAAASGVRLADSEGYRVHFGTASDQEGIVDEVLATVFRGPRSYTGEDMVEISCHGSSYIRKRILDSLVTAGARTAEPGEFTIRAFLAGKMDLSQAEAVADIIASTDRASHRLAINQMRGGYSSEFSHLRDEMLRLVSLLELELDFSEEDVEFADRRQLSDLTNTITARINSLKETFRLGNAIKEGVAVTIIGRPNVGKSTLLNSLVNEDRVLVSDIPGTTRDIIEEAVVVNGVRFRFIDTAGLRKSEDVLENMGIERSHLSAARADIVLLLVESHGKSSETAHEVRELYESIGKGESRVGKKVLLVINKADKIPSGEGVSVPFADAVVEELGESIPFEKIISISAKYGDNMDSLTDALYHAVDTEPLYSGDTVVANARHYEALDAAAAALVRVGESLEAGIPNDLLAQDIREALHYLGSITGQDHISSEEVLGSIFGGFCIGK